MGSSLSERASVAVWGVSHEVQGIADRDEYLCAVGEMLLRLIPADVAGWNAVDVAAGKAEVLAIPAAGWDAAEIARQLGEVAAVHPMTVSYLREQSSGSSPRRLSDVATRAELLRNAAYVEFLRPLGAKHQLTVLAAPLDLHRGRCWALNRDATDFSDGDLSVASALQPTLALLERALATPPTFGSPAAERLGLTAREVEVLEKVAAGLTADAVARLLRISGRTVRKHLENAYRKLDCHDRLVAVHRARALGVIQVEEPSWSGLASS